MTRIEGGKDEEVGKDDDDCKDDNDCEDEEDGKEREDEGNDNKGLIDAGADHCSVH